MESATEIKRYVDIVWRRKWWFVVPVLVAAASGCLVMKMMPKVYRATTTILVTRQSVPDDVVRSTVAARTEERMRSFMLRILGRSSLEQLARELGMISAGASAAEVERVCAMLGGKIDAEFDTRNYSWLRIAVVDGDPGRAADIANRLAELFIDQESRARASQAAAALEATGGWEEQYRRELAKRDEEISEFKRKNAYDLPDQQAANMQFLSAAQYRSAQLANEIRSRNARLAALRAQQNQAQPQDPRLRALRRELAELLGTYTEQNPIVMRKREQIAEFIRTTPPAAAAVPAALADETATIESEIQALERDRAEEEAVIATSRERIGNAPQVQQRLSELTRDYDQVKHQLDAAVVQNEQAKRSQDLEASKQAEKFQIQERAFPTTVPYKSNLRALLTVLGLGVMVGVGSVAVRELVDQTVRSEEEFTAKFPDLPVYAVISNLDVEPQARGARAAVTAGRIG